MERYELERRTKVWTFVRNHPNISKIYFKKSIEYGAYCEIYEYYKQKITFKENNRQDRKWGQGSGDRNKFSLSRARQNIYRLVEANVGKHGNYKPVFFTLTYRDNETLLDVSNRKFSKFIQRLNYECGFKIKYLVVPEFQKRGAIHYHGVFFNLPYIGIETFKHIWDEGSVDLEVVGRIKSISRYIAKYLSKDFIDKRLYGEKAYFTSRGLQKVIHTLDTQYVDLLLQNAIMVPTAYFNDGKVKIIKYKKI